MLDNETCVDVNYYIHVVRGTDDFTRLLPVRIGFTIVYATIFSFGFIGNAMAVVGVVRMKRLQSPRNILLVSGRY